MSNDDRDAIAAEITRLHDFLSRWYNGNVDNTDEIFNAHCSDHLSADFLNVQPGGARLTRAVFNAVIKGGYGANPDFKTHIRNVEIRLQLEAGRFWLVTYEEYQRGAKSSAPLNARFSTLLIEKQDDGVGTNTFLWHHLHETWLPEDHHGPELFEF